MKISVSSYSFSKMKISQLEAISRAHEIGLRAIEFTDLVPPEGVTQEEYALQIRAEAERLGMTINSYTVSGDFLNGSDGDLEAEIEKIKKKVDIAALLGVTVMRHDATRGYAPEAREYRGFDQALPTLAKGYRAVTEYAATKGIRTCVENHGYFCQDSDRVEKLINTVAHPNFGWLVDMGNFLCVDENPVTAVSRAASYAVHAHAKDFFVRSGSGVNPGRGFFVTRGGNYIRGSIIGQGDVPVYQCIRILKKAGYDGYLSIEFEGVEDPMYGIAVGFENLQRLIALAEENP